MCDIFWGIIMNCETEKRKDREFETFLGHRNGLRKWGQKRQRIWDISWGYKCIEKLFAVSPAYFHETDILSFTFYCQPIILFFGDQGIRAQQTQKRIVQKNCIHKVHLHKNIIFGIQANITAFTKRSSWNIKSCHTWCL